MSGLVNIFEHFALTVSDLDRSLEFYCGLMGLKEVERHRLEGEMISKMAGKEDVVMQVVRLQSPDSPDFLIDLQQYLSPEGGVSNAKLGDVGHTHICLGVKDIMETYRDLSAKGVRFVSGPVSFDLDFGVVRVVFLEDPDGSILELMEYPVQKK